ncbi:dihydrofolate reductase [Pseudoclavibacter endophyticus]|uniref:Dihydrofolate reductase n=1 Tax=Pseudoclavibacter endophyticus TaxID=1778590 RepID=A0A6H9WNB3_9MICO|nr:dihydrofolate reductase family protein [Pseudoclavibacter endophyticus]KAB1650356.1 dihydrofolate reductase [Pseudoclavibacter endophyticus]GGA54862.1 dihydrofolate reductase [Pseudoclavibacter endophyticus]
MSFRRKLIVTENVTLDGSIEMLEPWFSAEAENDEDDLIEEMTRQDATNDAVLFGRKTFEDMRGYWPHQTEDRTGVTETLNRVTKYVVSSTLDDPDWERSVVLTGDPVEEVRNLKGTDGQDIVCTGSISLVHALIPSGLVDEYRLFVYPSVQGRGRRLFPDGYVVPRLELLETKPFRSGVVLTRYRPL